VRSFFSKFIRLLRVKTMVIYLFPLVLALSVGLEQTRDGTATIVPYSWLDVLFGYLAFLCGWLFISTLNFYVDVPSDRLHDGLYKDTDVTRQPFATGEMSTADTIFFFLFSLVGCVVFSLLVNLRFTMFMLAVVFLIGVLYSHPSFRFKAKPVLDVLTNATGAVLILITGMSIVSSDFPPAIPMIFGWFFAATLYMPSVANDAPFDAAAGFRTSGVVFGQRRLLLATIPTTIICVGVGIWAVLTPSLSWQYRLFDGLGIFAAVGFTALMFYLWHPPHIELNALILVVPVTVGLLFYFSMGIYYLVA
jgi:4-hydroxybenzoate polyprenyltransferase